MLLGTLEFVEQHCGPCCALKPSEQFQKVLRMVQITVGFNWPNEGLFFIIFFYKYTLAG